MPWDIKVYGGLTMRCYPNSRGAGLLIYSNGMIDFDDNQFTMRYLREGDAFVDVGANIGSYTILAASRVGKRGKVVSFEACRATFERLTENISLNQLEQVEPRFAAVGPSNDKVQFIQSLDLTNRLARNGTDDSQEAIDSVPCVRLDDALAERRYALGKIDIEGAEPIAFSAGRKILGEGNPPVWLIEMKDNLLQRYGFSADEFARLLGDSGFALASYDAEANTLAFSDRSWQGRENVVAIHHSARQETIDRLNCDVVNDSIQSEMSVVMDREASPPTP